ncbi:MAG TPA: sugar ABC transporter substrate-binding protein, partial [Egibacteraceae bacterium]|nr:sugar ABC transporter substrate-binding protein [Egibacteraceae bacterium]
MRLVSAMAAVVLAACATAAPQSADLAEIQFVLFGDATETAGYQRMIDEFHETTPGVRVTMSPVAKQDDLLAKLTTGFAGGSPPDVFLINYRKYGQFAAQGVLAPVQPYLDASDNLDEGDFAQTSMDAFRFDGEELTCLPQNVSSLVVYYNADAFADAGVDPPTPGWSWDDFLAAAQALTGDGRYGVGVEPSLIRLAPFVWSAGGDLVDDHEDPTRLTILDGRARAAVDFFLDLQSEHGVVPPEREELSLDAESRFVNGGLGMLLDSRRVVPTLRTITGFEWDVAPLPVAPG